MDYSTCDLNDLQSLVSKEPITHYTCDCHTKSCIYSRILFCSGCGKSIANNIQDIHKELDEIHAAEQVLLFRKAVESVKKFKIETLAAFGLNEDSEICFRVVDLYSFAWRQRWRKVAGIDNFDVLTRLKRVGFLEAQNLRANTLSV